MSRELFQPSDGSSESESINAPPMPPIDQVEPAATRMEQENGTDEHDPSSQLRAVAAVEEGRSRMSAFTNGAKKTLSNTFVKFVEKAHLKQGIEAIKNRSKLEKSIGTLTIAGVTGVAIKKIRTTVEPASKLPSGLFKRKR